MSTCSAGSFSVCCCWQVVRNLWSLHMSGIPHHTDLHPGRNVYLTSWVILSVLFWQVVRNLWSLHVSGIPITRTSTLVGMSTWPAGSFCLCCFWWLVRHLWSLQVSEIPYHNDLHPGRNVYSTYWFILSVLFLTDGETSVVPTSVWDSPSYGPPPW